MQCIAMINVKGQSVPCGKCNFCLQKRRADWSFRLRQELKRSESSHFITLTYDEENVPLLPIGDGTEEFNRTLYKPDFQNFMKRLRKLETGSKLKYYAVGEYGENTYRPHYHAILFNMLNDTNAVKAWSLDGRPLGFVHFGKVTDASIHYVTGYVVQRSLGDFKGVNPPFSLMSKGLGLSYLDRVGAWHNSSKDYVMMQGVKGRLPRYYRDRLLDKGEKRYSQIVRQVQAHEDYLKEIERLSKYHSNPVEYYYQIEESAYKSVYDKYSKTKTI